MHGVYILRPVHRCQSAACTSIVPHTPHTRTGFGVTMEGHKILIFAHCLWFGVVCVCGLFLPRLCERECELAVPNICVDWCFCSRACCFYCCTLLLAPPLLQPLNALHLLVESYAARDTTLGVLLVVTMTGNKIGLIQDFSASSLVVCVNKVYRSTALLLDERQMMRPIDVSG